MTFIELALGKASPRAEVYHSSSGRRAEVYHFGTQDEAIAQVEALVASAGLAPQVVSVRHVTINGVGHWHAYGEWVRE